MSKTIFQKIIAREIPAKIEHEDEHCVVLHDIQPQAPVHLLIVPKKLIPRVSEAAPEDQAVLGHLLLVAAHIAKKLQLTHGFRLVPCSAVTGEGLEPAIAWLVEEIAARVL